MTRPVRHVEDDRRRAGGARTRRLGMAAGGALFLAALEGNPERLYGLLDVDAIGNGQRHGLLPHPDAERL